MTREKEGKEHVNVCLTDKLCHILLLSDLLASSIILLSHRDRPWPSDLWPGVSVSGISTVF